MDLNYLFHRQQVEKSKAESADSAAARKAHEEMAKRYQDEIERVSDGKVNFAAVEEAAYRPALQPKK